MFFSSKFFCTLGDEKLLFFKIIRQTMLLTMPIKKFQGLIYKIINLPCHLTQRKGQITFFTSSSLREPPFSDFRKKSWGGVFRWDSFGLLGFFGIKGGCPNVPTPSTWQNYCLHSKTFLLSQSSHWSNYLGVRIWPRFSAQLAQQPAG